MRRVLIVVVVLVLAGLAANHFLSQQQGSASDQSGAQLQTAEVTRGDITMTVRATGSVEPERTADLRFETAGVVQAIPVQAGQQVSEGQILAQLDGEAQRIALEQANWAQRIAEINLQAAQEPPSERDLNAAQANVNSAWAAYVDLRDNSVDAESIRIAELRYEQARAGLDEAEKAYREANGAAAQDAQRGAASFAAEIARLQLEQLRGGPSRSVLNASQAQVAQAQAQVELLRAGPTQAQLDQLAISVAQAELQAERAQAAYDETVLRAPFAGTIHRVNIQVGGLVSSAGLPAIQLVDLGELHVTIEVDEVDIAAIAPGQPVEVTLDALPGEIVTATVERVADISAQQEGVIVYPVRLELDGTDVPLRAGMTAAASVTVQQVNDVITVPNIYVRLDRRTGRAFVAVVEDEGLVEREIVLGIQGEELSEVKSGLAVGDVVGLDLGGSGFSFFGGTE